MSQQKIETVATNLKKGGIIAAIITLLISFLFLFLNSLSDWIRNSLANQLSQYIHIKHKPASTLAQLS